MSARYGWVVVAAAFTLMLVGFAAAYSFAAFFGAFHADFGATRGDIALVFSVAAFLSLVLGAPGGMLADRFGARRVAGAGVACLALALWLASRASSLATLYATYSIGVGLGVGLVYVPSIGAVQPWFGANRAFASGLAVAGIGAGNIVGPLFAARCISLLGWRGACVALALFCLALGGMAAAALTTPPTLRHGGPLPGMDLRRAAKTRPFWLLYASLVASCLGLFVPMVHLGPYAQDLGYSAADGVALVSLIGLGSLLGRFVIGGLADRLGRLASLAVMYVGLGIALVVWWASSTRWMLALFSLAFGAFYGGYAALVPTIVMDLYGPRAVSAIIGWLYTGGGIATLAGPWLAGVAYDRLGRYDVPILLAALFSFIAAGCVAVLLNEAKPATLPVPSKE
jgi:MFS family permease